MDLGLRIRRASRQKIKKGEYVTGKLIKVDDREGKKAIRSTK